MRALVMDSKETEIMKVSENFTRDEFACKCGKCEKISVDTILLQLLQRVRSHFNKKTTITSGNRCMEHNTKIGGSPHSQHMNGTAADIDVKDISPVDVYNYIESINKNIGGLGLYDNFVHVDVRRKPARWDNRSKT